YALTAGTTVRNRRVLFLQKVQDIQNHHILASRKLYLNVLHIRGIVSFRVITVKAYQHLYMLPLVDSKLRHKRVDGFWLHIHITLTNLLVQREVDGVLQPVLIVTLRKVITGMGAAAFFSLAGRDSC